MSIKEFLSRLSKHKEYKIIDEFSNVMSKTLETIEQNKEIDSSMRILLFNWLVIKPTLYFIGLFCSRRDKKNIRLYRIISNAEIANVQYCVYITQAFFLHLLKEFLFNRNIDFYEKFSFENIINFIIKKIYKGELIIQKFNDFEKEPTIMQEKNEFGLFDNFGSYLWYISDVYILEILSILCNDEDKREIWNIMGSEDIEFTLFLVKYTSGYIYDISEDMREDIYEIQENIDDLLEIKLNKIEENNINNEVTQ